MIASHLKTFLAVSQLHSFSAAARQLGVSQPHVSRQIQHLETLSGNLLFDRVGRSIRMTQFGHDLLAVAKRLTDAEVDALSLLNDARYLQAGHLRLAAVGPYHLNLVLAVFTRRFPKVQVSVRFGDSASVERAVLEMEADVGLLAVKRRVPNCGHRTLRRCPIVLQVPASHPFSMRETVSVKELQGQSLIAREPTSTTRRLFDDLLLDHGVQVKTTLEMGSREAIRLAVAEGLGVGYVSAQECDPHPHVRYVRLVENPVMTNATLVWRQGKEASGVTGAFLSCVDDVPALAGE